LACFEIIPGFNTEWIRTLQVLSFKMSLDSKHFNKEVMNTKPVERLKTGELFPHKYSWFNQIDFSLAELKQESMFVEKIKTANCKHLFRRFSQKKNEQNLFTILIHSVLITSKEFGLSGYYKKKSVEIVLPSYHNSTRQGKC
jgi:hypothetical protein